MRSTIAAVAQLDRALVYGTKGWGFEPLQPQYRGQSYVETEDDYVAVADDVI